jgi:hypothetical protein
VSLTSSGNKYYVASDAAGEGVYRGVGSGAGTKLWNNDITYTRATLGYSMQRLMGAFDNKVYELGADPGAPPVNLSTLTPIYTHPNTAFVWTSFATGTSAIYATGHDGQRGYVYKFALTSTGAAPTLSGGAVLAASMPLGETLLSAEVYLGKFMGMGTSRGFRIAEIDDNGDLAYGPLLFEISGGVKAMAGFDRFFWVGATASVNGKSGLYRVDLGQVLVQQAQGGGNPTIRYAYATDLSTPPADNKTGTVTGVTPLGTTGRMVLGVNSGGSYVEHATEYEATGVMTTGKVRFNTLENKLYKFMSIRTPDPLQGGLSVSSLDKAGNAVSLISYTTTVAPGGNDVAITAPEGPQEFISLQFTLTRNGGDATKGPELNGWQIKAVPGVIRQRMITMSFLMFDFEVDKAGQKLGYAGRTKDRLRSIEMSAQTGEALQFQDLQANTSDLVFVEDMEFKQMASPGKGTHAGSYGGVLTVQMRTVNDNVNL